MQAPCCASLCLGGAGHGGVPGLLAAALLLDHCAKVGVRLGPDRKPLLPDVLCGLRVCHPAHDICCETLLPA